jgi:hypothetical protein
LRKLEALKIGVVQREEKKEKKKNTFYELKRFFFLRAIFSLLAPFRLHFEDDF